MKTLGVLRDSSEKALLTYIKKRTGVERMEWLKPSQFQHIIETLKEWVDRETLSAKAKKQVDEDAMIATQMAALTAASCIG